MLSIEYIDLFEIVQEKGCRAVRLSCCDSAKDAFSLLRVQMQGDIYYTYNSIYVADEAHDRKCEELLRIANREGIDLLLFPEYCISMSLLRQITDNERMWPNEMKLWCLPCQGIPKPCYESLMEELRGKEHILLIEDAVRFDVDSKKFVNVMFYCFRVQKDGKIFLCLAPQMKTQHMGDPTCACEVVGLTTGSKIFTLGGRLITFLCADTLNNSITWQDLQHEKLSNGLIMLHPQMNESPKHPEFSQKRRDMWNHTQSGLCITCNWAAGTRLISADARQKTKEIRLSWSCIYAKHAELPFEKWQANIADVQKESADCDLFAAFMEKQKTEVWFSTSTEQAITVILPNQVTDQYAATSIRSLKAINRYCWEDSGWKPSHYSTTLAERMKSAEAKEKLGQAADIQTMIKPRYHYPFTEQDKYLVDQFFSITLPNAEKALLTIDTDENLADWAILLDEKDFCAARDAFRDLCALTCKALKSDAIPRRLYGLKGEHTFIGGGFGNDGSRFNVDSSAGKMRVVFAKDDVSARKLSKNLLEDVFENNSSLAESRLGVVYPDFTGEKFHFLPEYTDDISRGDHIVQEGDLTNGRD